MPLIRGTSIEYETKKHGEITSAYTFSPFFAAWNSYLLHDSSANTLCRWASPTQTIRLQKSESVAYVDVLWIVNDPLDPKLSFYTKLVTDDTDDTLQVITKLDIQKYKLVIDGYYYKTATESGTGTIETYKAAGEELPANSFITRYITHWEAKNNPTDRTADTTPVIRYYDGTRYWYWKVPDMFNPQLCNDPRNNELFGDYLASPYDNDLDVGYLRAPITAQNTWAYPPLRNSMLVGTSGDFAMIFDNPTEQRNVLSVNLTSTDAMLRSIACLGVYFEYDGVMYLGFMDETGQTTGEYLTEDKWNTSAQWNSGNINNFTEHTDPFVPTVSIKDKEHEMPLAYISGNAGMVTFYEINKTGLASADDISDAISRFDISQIGKDALRNLISFKAFAAINVNDTVDRQIKIAGIPLEDSGGNALTGRVIGGVKPIDLFATSGGVTIPTLYNDYRDYEPYTKIQMYVPFCGWFSLPSWCIGKKITGTMFTDLYNGTVKAVIYASQTVVAEVGGCCAYDIPFVADSTGAKASAVISSALTTAAAVGATVAMPNVATGIAAVSSAANLAATLNGNDTTLKGVLGDGSNLNGLLHVYIKVSRPKSPNGSTNIPDSYKHEIGIPTMKEVQISAGDGYIQVMDAKVTGNMTAREKQMIIEGFRHGLNF